MALAEAPLEPMIPKWSLGDRLVKARKHAGLKQAEMAAALSERLDRDISGPAVSTWERDEHEPTDLLGVVRAWADITGVDPAWLGGFTYADR